MLMVLVDSLGGQVVLNFAESGACRDYDQTDTRTLLLQSCLQSVWIFPVECQVEIIPCFLEFEVFRSNTTR